MEFTTCKDQGRKGEGVKDVAHIYRPAGRVIIRNSDGGDDDSCVAHRRGGVQLPRL